MRFKRVTQASGDLAPSRATVFRWFAEFKRGRTSLINEERNGRPTSVVTEENISAVEALIKEDPRRTYKDIEGALGISSSSVSTILHQHLRVRKISSRWVPHHLSDGLKCTRVEWCTEMLRRFNNVDSRRVSDIVTGEETWIYEQAPTKVKRQRSVGKKMWPLSSQRVVIWHCCASGSEDSYSEMVYRSLAPPSILKNSGEAAKDRTARNSAPP